jgi:hypothetical protein
LTKNRQTGDATAAGDMGRATRSAFDVIIVLLNKEIRK